ncbi:protein KRI1 homolog [Anneissia japonica]|uniref:protein KRI1 homolog n=1 Tax=Anneissia japonica TaxID=1529436 RepID=UPI00142597CC|nr:protein KRI1 homolog [Anneissia japonica]
MASSEDEDLEFRINSEFAEKYDSWRRKEELQKLKDRYGDDGADLTSSSSESEDEDAEALTPQLEKDFLKTLSFVKSHDPKIYKKDATFYHYEDDAAQPQKKKVKKEKPMYLKDLERKLIIEKTGELSDEDEENEEDNRRPWSPTYVEEQQILKDSFKTALEDTDNEEDGIILKKKHKSIKDQAEEEADYISWLKGQTDRTVDPIQEMSALKQYWNDPNLDEGEQFLRDYILNKGYVDKDTEDNLPSFHEIAEDEVEFSEEERLLEEQDDFERKYNFRFEEPDSDFIKRYPRTVGESVRRKDKKRADKRQEIKTRKEEKKQKMKEDLKQLKNLKKKEIIDRLEKLKQVTGKLPVDFENEDLEGDFDPDEHDKLMQRIFDDGYEECCEDETKPEFNDEELDLENWDEWNGENVDEYGGEEDEEATHCEDPSFNMDADYVPPSRTDFSEEMAEITGKKKRRRASKFAQAVGRKKPVFNPDEGAFDAYIDEYYKMDYEDVIGDIPCRFKYRNVVANDFGLTTESILNAREKELNQWASLKKTCQYRSEEEELRDVKAYNAKAKYSDKMKKIFTSLYSEKTGELEEEKPQRCKASNPIEPKQQVKTLNLLPKIATSEDTEKFHRKEIIKTEHKIMKTKKPPKEKETIMNTPKTENIVKESAIRAAELKERNNFSDSVSKKSKKAIETKLKKRKSMSKSQPEVRNFGQISGRKFKKGFRNRTSKVPERNILRGRNAGSVGKRKIGNSGIEVSDARLKAYGIDPKKYIYRMKFLAKLKSRKEKLQKKSKS